MSPNPIDLNVLVKSSLFKFRLKSTETVGKMYEKVLKDKPLLLKNVTKDDCIFRQLDPPIEPDFEGEGACQVSDATLSDLKSAKNKLMKPMQKISSFFDPDLTDGIHAVIQLPGEIKLNVTYEVLSDAASSEICRRLQHDMCNCSDCYTFYKYEPPVSVQYDDETGLVLPNMLNNARKFMQPQLKIKSYFDSDLEADADAIHISMELPKIIKLNVSVQNDLVSINICDNEHDVKDIYKCLYDKVPIKVHGLLKLNQNNCKLYKLEPVKYDKGTDLLSDVTVNKFKHVFMQPEEKIARYFSLDLKDRDGDIRVMVQLPDKIYSQINLNVRVCNTLVSIDISNNRVVDDIYDVVLKAKEASLEIKSLLNHVAEGDYELHKFQRPGRYPAEANTERMVLTREVYHYFSSDPDVGLVHVMMKLPRIKLNVLIYNAHVTIDIGYECFVRDIYQEAKILLPEDVKRKMGGLQTSKLIFERIDSLIEYQVGGDSAYVSDETTKECQKAERKTMVDRFRITTYFACTSLSELHIHVVIRPPEDAIDSAINQMKRIDSNLYERLQVKRTNPNAWSRADYPPFMEISNVSAHIKFKDKLTATRNLNIKGGNRFFKLALSVLGKSMFGKILSEDAQNLPNNFMPDDPAVVSDGFATVSAKELELQIFSTLEPAFVKRIERFKGENTSSHFKQALFLWHFVLHPALAVEMDGHLKFTTENPSLIKYYIMCKKEGGEWKAMGSFKPCSDIAIISSKLGCPLLLCEVDSNERKKDKHQMLAVATSAVRVGQYLLGTADLFVLMAIFVTKDFIVECCLVSQTNVDNIEVVITEQTFDLGKSNDAYEFLRQMYNFAHHANKMAEKLDKTKQGLLQKMNEVGNNIRSYESNKKPVTRDTGSGGNNQALPSIPENQNEETDALEEVWERNDVRDKLKKQGYNTEDRFDMIGHPEVIAIEKKGKGLVYMKYISRENIRELEILQFLKECDSSWTYVLPFQHWNVNGGTIVEFPRGGFHVTDFLKSGSSPIPIALQLVEAVKFLHEHNVAHRDIKSENILVNPNGKLWVIDYSLACRVNGEGEMRKGFVGTPGCVAPEVRKEDGAYSPVRADRWAVGYVIKTICSICGPSPQQKFLEHLSSSLMVHDPSSRLTMQECFELIVQEQSKQLVVNARAPSKFINGGNNQPLAVAS